MLFTEVQERHHIATGVVTREVVLYSQPRWRHLLAQAYHWWDSLTGPLLIRAERRVPARWMPGDEAPSVRQDLRCYRLMWAGREAVGTLEATSGA